MLTAKQQRVYLFIRDYINRHGLAPTQKEIASNIGVKSRGLIQRYINALVNAGLLITKPGRKRNIFLNKNRYLPYSRLPIIGKISAGEPIESVDDDRVLDLAGTLLGPNRFILEVKGDSMIGDNICDGDYIICERREEVNDGEIVVAVIDGANTTLKRVKRNSEVEITLLPSNPLLKPTVYPTNRISFKGVYLGLIRLNPETNDALSKIKVEKQTVS